MKNQKNLEQLLQASGSPLNKKSLEALVQGVAAAPISVDQDEWISLVSEAPSLELKATLQLMLADASNTNSGLDGERTHPNRIKALRAEMIRNHVDGFIVPRCDAHQGEYVSLNSERLAWLTGFTGSAGTAVVLTEKAAVFIDGRYTLQAQVEVDSRVFEICPMADLSPSDWISRMVVKGSKLAYDPWLLTPTQVSKFQLAAKKAEAELVSVSVNLIDQVWLDRPQDPVSPVRVQTNPFNGQATADKRMAIANNLAAQGISAIFLSAPDSIAWLLNIRGADVPYTPFALSFAILNSDSTASWFVDERKLTKDVLSHLGNGVTVHKPEQLEAALKKLGSEKATVNLSPSEHPAWVFQKLEEAGAEIHIGSDPCQLIKAVKNQTEISGIRNAHLRDGAAICKFLAWVNQNAPNGSISELSASNQLGFYRQQNDLFRGLSFPTIAGSGPNGAIVHYRVSEKTNRPLDQNSLFLVDSGAQYVDGTTDITRTIAIGKPSNEMCRNFTLVLKGHIALAQAKFPKGTTGSQLDILARSHLWNAGLDYDHGTGHGVGAHLSVHEGPQRISKMPSTVALQPGMIISNEPGYYKTGAYGIRIENLICVRSLDKNPVSERSMLRFETLTFAPIDMRLVDFEILTNNEISWLNTYHAQVLKKIGPQLESADLTWLEKSTKPLKL